MSATSSSVPHWSQNPNPFDNSEEEEEENQLNLISLDESLPNQEVKRNVPSQSKKSNNFSSYKQASSSSGNSTPNVEPHLETKESSSSSSDSDSNPSTRRKSSPPSQKRNHRTSWKKPGPNSFENSYPSPSSSTWNGHGSSSKSYAAAAKKFQKISVIQNASDLSVFGSFKPLEAKHAEHELISKYIYNSVYKCHVEIHSIFSFKKSAKIPKMYTTEQHKTLLWCKTTPYSIKRMKNEGDGWVAFYDRVSRALAVPMDKPSRQIILLCSVSLRNIISHKNGYQTWKYKVLPTGVNSIKGTGRWIPDHRGNNFVKSTMVPCGKTIENTKYPSYEQEYNEYLIFQSNQVKVKYAVDIEITPSQYKGRIQ